MRKKPMDTPWKSSGLPEWYRHIGAIMKKKEKN